MNAALSLIGAALANQALGGFPVPALKHHGAAVGADAQDGGRAFAPGRQALGPPAKFPQQPLPPGTPRRSHICHYSKALMIYQYFQDNRWCRSRLQPVRLTILHFPFEFSNLYMVCKKITYMEKSRTLGKIDRD
jgi:hypothetical protein